MTFGPAFSRALRDGMGELNRALENHAEPSWVLDVFCLESGLDPLARNKRSGAFGLWQKMPPYEETDPAVQCRDYFRFTLAMLDTFGIRRLASREALYCVNLAPARLRNGGGERASTVLYSSVRIDASEAARLGVSAKELAATRWQAGYEQNSHLDRPLPDGRRKGWIAISDLGPKLDEFVAKCKTRRDAELAALLAVDVPTI